MDFELYEILKLVAPGTPLRAGLDNILKAKRGALIVIGNNKEVLDIAQDGFYINCEYTPSNLYELGKMDGAIIISSDLKRILYANVKLYPCHRIQSKETGTRHKTAEQVAKQTGALVIAVSERRHIITLYKSDIKYVLKDINEIINKTSQAVKTLEKYKDILDESIDNLTCLEIKDAVTLNDVTYVIHRMEMLWRIVNEINLYIAELGIEGRLFNMQVMESVRGLPAERINILKDYINPENRDHVEVLKEISQLKLEELLDLELIANILGYEKGSDSLELKLRPKGYRILSKIYNIPASVIENIVSTFGNLANIMKASSKDLELVDGVGRVRAARVLEVIGEIQEGSIKKC
ncbi:MAG: DNA integrity scanning protein DisA [Tissierellia bacterium]|nr:DNA integrity scanning protein DisA [Tissierellia bacterium]